MTLKQPFSIKGIGHFLPPTILLSSKIEQELDLPHDWLGTHLGVTQRHRANGLTCTDMAKTALDEALADAQIDITQLDYLIGASATFDHVIPNRASLIKHRYTEAAEVDFPGIDINTVCTSFISAVHYAALLLQDERVKHIGIVSSEIASNGLNPADKETYGLFGDGAAAVILGKSEVGGVISYKLSHYASQAMDTVILGGGNAYHPKNYPYDAELYSFKMQGNSLLKNALKVLPPFLNDLCDLAELKMEDIDTIAPHQASKNGLRMLTHLNNGDTENVINNLSTQGNCIAASIPLALYSAIKEEKLSEGNTCLLLGTAAGLSVCGMILKYSKI
jgi:3-oxoacyl-[acyl-carrier-protein] synthase-3